MFICNYLILAKFEIVLAMRNRPSLVVTRGAAMRRAIRKKDQAGEGSEESTNPSQRIQMSQLKTCSENCQSIACLAKGLSDENRLRIFLSLSGKKKSVSAIVDEVGLSQPLVSHHLKELKRCLLVTIERNGPFIFYRLADPRILTVVQTLNSIAADLLAARKTI
jgi:DNA-binding transcriptional ArsR family regulator